MQITIRNLEKRYREGTLAISRVNLDIESGMFGLLGPNGAGKTTLMRILVTLMKPTDGTVTVNGLDIRHDRAEIRKMIGYLPQEFTMFSKLKTWEFLDYAARLAGIKSGARRKKAVEEHLEAVGLYEVRERQANKLSGGMKRRLGIAQALIGDPKILIVDEPTTGLDPEERLRFRNLMANMSRQDMIIILSTHIVGDISSTCTNMALLFGGEVAYCGPPERLVEQARGHTWLVQTDDLGLARLDELYPVVSTIPSTGGWDVQVVSERLDDFPARLVEPNLEHGYVYFLEHTLKHSWHDEQAAEHVSETADIEPSFREAAS